MMHICISKLTTIGPDNGFSPEWCQTINRSNAGILLIEPLGINLSEILIEIYAFSFNTMQLKIPSGKWQPFCLSLHVLMQNKCNSIPDTPELQVLCIKNMVYISGTPFTNID